MAIEVLGRLELERRVSGVKFTELSEKTGIPYKRLWRFFRESGPLTRQELARVEIALSEGNDELSVQTAHGRADSGDFDSIANRESA